MGKGAGSSPDRPLEPERHPMPLCLAKGGPKGRGREMASSGLSQSTRF